MCYEFKLGNNSPETSRNMCVAFGKGGEGFLVQKDPSRNEILKD